MKNSQGFSLIEVMIAAAVMMVIAFGVQQVLSNTSKSAGDIEKRMRFRDLVDDIRFQFLIPGLCEKSAPGAFQEDAEIHVALSRDVSVAKDVTLTEYGLKVTHLQLKNVQKVPDSIHTLTMPNGQYLGEFRESGELADIYLEAQLLGSGHALKPMSVVRIARLHRAGSVNEELCIANHDVPGRAGGSLAAGGKGGAGGIDGGASGNDPGFAFDAPEPAAAAPAPGGKPTKGGTYNPAAECWIRDQEVKTATGRVRLIDGETVKFSRFEGQLTYLKCVNGRLEETTKVQ